MSTRLAAPVVVCSDGCPSWSGKAAEEMTALELVAMLRFARDQGETFGRLDRQLHQPHDMRNPFDPDLFDGMPYDYWTIGYATGYNVALEFDDQLNTQS